MELDFFKPVIDMGKYLDSIVEEDKQQLVEDGIDRLMSLFIIVFCLGVVIGIEIVFCVLRLREMI